MNDEENPPTSKSAKTNPSKADPKHLSINFQINQISNKSAAMTDSPSALQKSDPDQKPTVTKDNKISDQGSFTARTEADELSQQNILKSLNSCDQSMLTDFEEYEGDYPQVKNLGLQKTEEDDRNELLQELQKIIRVKDNFGETGIHRAARDQSSQLFREVKKLANSKTDHIKNTFATEFLDLQGEILGDTPLTISTMEWNDVEKQKIQCRIFVYTCLKHNADPNKSNKHSLWTPLHWACFYGDEEVVEMLLKNKASPCLPDIKGNFPMDLAGEFNHDKIVQKLVLKSIELIRDAKRGGTFEKTQRSIDPKAKENKVGKEIPEVINEEDRLHDFRDVFLLSDYYSSKLLFWACQNPFITANEVKTIIEELPAYPEAALKMRRNQTSLHAVAMCVYKEQKGEESTQENPEENAKRKLEAIIKELTSRFGLAAGDDNAIVNIQDSQSFDRLKELKYFQDKFEQIIGDPKNFKLSKFRSDYLAFKQRRKQNQKNLQQHDLYKVEDDYKNSPLHIAAIFGNVQVFTLMINLYNKIETTKLKNSDGIDIFEIAKRKKEMASLLHVENLETKSHELNILSALRKRYQTDKLIPTEPQVCLQLSLADRKMSLWTDNILRMMVKSFRVACYMSLDQKSIYAIIDLSSASLKEEAEEMEFPVKLNNYSAKIAFNQQIPAQYIVPFSQKDKQQIIIEKFEKIFNVNYLLKQKVLLKRPIPLHSKQGLTDFENARQERGLRGCKKFIYMLTPHIFRTIEQYIFEDYEQTKFTDLNAYKNYFGEKRCLLNSFYEFFATWWILPSLLAVPLVSYQFMDKNNQDTRVNVLFALFVAFWAQIITEMYKRKEYHINLHWGLVTPEEETELLPNPDFIGYSTFSWTQLKSSRKKKENVKSEFINAASYITSATLVALSVGAYILCKEAFKQDSFKQAIVLNVVVSGINYLYKFLVSLFITKQNFKYKAHKQKEEIFRFAIFKFINIHLPIVFALISFKLQEQKLDDDREEIMQLFRSTLGIPAADNFKRAFEDSYASKMMSDLILGAVVSQIGGAIGARYCLYAALYFKAKVMYWWNFRKLAKIQQAKHQENYKSASSKKSFAEVKNNMENFNKLHFFAGVVPDYNPVPIESNKSTNSKVAPLQEKSKTEEVNLSDQKSEKQKLKEQERKYSGSNLLYKQVLQIFDDEGKYMEGMKYNIDYIEENMTMMQPRTEQMEILEMCERLQLISFSMLYAGVCPVATPILLVYQVMDNWLMKQVDTKFIQRPVQKNMKSLNDAGWLTYLEIVTVLVAISNTFLLFIVSRAFRELLMLLFKTYSTTQQFVFVVAAEHGLLFLVVGLKALIPDFPRQLKKKKQTTETAIFEDKELQRFTQTTYSRKKKVQQIQAPTPPIQEKKVLQEVIKPKQTRLLDFLPPDMTIRMNNDEQVHINDSLKINFANKLFRETFLIVERAILQLKFQRLQKSSTVVHVICSQCNKQSATIYCFTCLDHMCNNCSEFLHVKACKGHQTQMIDLNPGRDISFNSRSVTPQRQQTNSLVTNWIKFEYFALPVNQSNEYFKEIQRHFELLRKVYIELNYMDEITGDIDYAAVFVDQNYDGLSREIGFEMMKRHIKKFKYSPLLLQKEKIDGTSSFFNGEELFFMNRIVFRLFKQRGVLIHFAEFIRDLRVLQQGSFEESLTLWLELANETDMGISKTKSKYAKDVMVHKLQQLNLDIGKVSKQKFTEMLQASYPQDREARVQVQKIVEQIYSNGMDDNKTIHLLKSAILENEAARQLMACVLQKNPDQK